MKNKEYIMVGAPIITKEIFRKVSRPLNNYSLTPNGGFWASEHTGNLYNISPWFTHIKDDATSIAGFKKINQSTIFTLKDNANILIMDSVQKAFSLADQYPSYHHILGYRCEITSYNTTFNYEKLSQDYDGIYINSNYFENQFQTEIFDGIRVNSLLLFNLDCIKEYQTTPIVYDIKNRYSIPYIKEETIGPKTKIEEESYEHKFLTSLTQELFLESINKYSNYSFQDYDDYLQTLTQILKNIIPIIKQEQDSKITSIIKYLESQKMYVEKDLLIQNILLNYLVEYFSQDEKRIKTLSKSKIKEPKSYYIF